MKYSFYSVIPEDVEELDPKDCFSVGELGCTKDLIALSVNGGADSMCLGFGDEDGRLHGIAGSYRQWRGSSQLWAIFDKKVDRHPLALAKTCLTLIHYARDKQALHRVSLTVRSDYTMGNRFAAALGFSLEGKMHGYLPDGADANLYARLF